MRALCVESDDVARASLVQELEHRGYHAEGLSDPLATARAVSDLAPDVVVLGLHGDARVELALLGELRRVDLPPPIVALANQGTITLAIAAMRAGAADYLLRPVHASELVLAIERALEHRDLRADAEQLRRAAARDAGETLPGLIGASTVMLPVCRVARQVAPARASVLITGESGTGKGEVAKAIHALSPRARGPFVPVHCAALSESLIDSELFGHERGSFTGAESQRKGRFEQAHGGTLFLDEIGEIAPATQVKLLRVLQERSFERVGGNATVHVDTRLIAATNRDLEADVATGRFREDLFYRLNVVRIEMPPLRTRGEDILLLAEHFIARFAAENGKRVDGLSDTARGCLLSARWPGNVRELENAIEQAVVVCAGTRLEEGDLPTFSAPDSCRSVRVPGATMRDLERYAILKTLEAVGWSTSRAARILGMGTRTIQYRIREYGLARYRPAYPGLARVDDALDEVVPARDRVEGVR